MNEERLKKLRENVIESSKKNHQNKMNLMVYHAEKLKNESPVFLTKTNLKKTTGCSYQTVSKYWDEILEILENKQSQKEREENKYYNYEPKTEIDPNFYLILTKQFKISPDEATYIIDQLNQSYTHTKLKEAFKKAQTRTNIKNIKNWIASVCDNQKDENVVLSRDGFRMVEATPQNMRLSEGRLEHMQKMKEIANKKLFEPI